MSWSTLKYDIQLLNGYNEVKSEPKLNPVWSALQIACLKQVPFRTNESKFGVTEDLFLPKVLSNLSESIVNKKIFGGMILDSLTNNSITIIIYLREFHQLWIKDW